MSAGPRDGTYGRASPRHRSDKRGDCRQQGGRVFRCCETEHGLQKELSKLLLGYMGYKCHVLCKKGVVRLLEEGSK